LLTSSSSAMSAPSGRVNCSNLNTNPCGLNTQSVGELPRTVKDCRCECINGDFGGVLDGYGDGKVCLPIKQLYGFSEARSPISGSLVFRLKSKANGTLD
jgi:hypothetical protein